MTTFTPVTVSLNGFLFDDSTQDPTGVLWNWQDLSGWFDTPDQTFAQQVNGFGTGVTVDQRNGRTISLTVLASSVNFGMQLNDLLYSAQRAMKAALAAAVTTPVLLKVNEPGVPLQAFVRQTGPAKQKMIGTRHMVQYLIPLLATDPRRYSQTLQTVNLTAGSNTVTNNGDLPTPVILTVGPSTNPSFQNTSATGNPTLAITGTVASATTLAIDTAAQTVEQDGIFNRSLLTTAQWWQLLPGANTVVVSDNCTITFRDAYS